MSESNNLIRNQLMDSGRLFEVVEILEDIRNYDANTFIFAFSKPPESWSTELFNLYSAGVHDITTQASILLAIITTPLNTYIDIDCVYLKNLHDHIKYKAQKARIDYVNYIMDKSKDCVTLRHIENLDLISIIIPKIIDGNSNEIVPEKYYLHEETSNNERNE